VFCAQKLEFGQRRCGYILVALGTLEPSLFAWFVGFSAIFVRKGNKITAVITLFRALISKLHISPLAIRNSCPQRCASNGEWRVLFVENRV
jgi:hypothetical protein